MLHIAMVFVIAMGIWQLGKFGKTLDTEVWNGQVTGKKREVVSCEHSYSCNCVTICSGSGKNQSCNTICQTCYDHSYDVDWVVQSTIGSFRINRLDSQGLRQPPRWEMVKEGQPVAKTHPFENYVKAVSTSLFYQEKVAFEKYKEYIPEYPLKVYDYHYLDRVLAVAVQVPNLKNLNHALALELRELGPKRQANIVIVLTSIQDPNYALGLKAAWQGAKKNDIIIAVGISEYPKISWAQVFSWSKNDMLNIVMRDELLQMESFNEESIKKIGKVTDENFVRRPMEEFEYLQDEIEPTNLELVFLTILGLAISCFIAFFFHRTEIFARS